MAWVAKEYDMRHTDYPRVIREDDASLRAEESGVRGTPAAPRLRMLRLLKNGDATNLPQVAALVGYFPPTGRTLVADLSDPRAHRPRTGLSSRRYARPVDR